jgi:(E)-4-hydroxy-3-methyl-but-2-enyl pyrophosphate reductase
MQVILAESMGFCFGVRDALATAERIEQPELVTIHGELVHNEAVRQRFADRGFRQQSETQRDSLSDSPQVLITAHGVSDAERSRLAASGKQLVDTTCPLVRRAHQSAMTLAAERRHVVVIGRAGHVEVRGLVGDLVDYSIVEAEADVRTWPHDRLGIVCQTTTPPDRAERIRAMIRDYNPQADIRFVNTICQPTIDRQRAVERLLPQVDAVVVVGGKNSNNTARLADVCREHGTPAYHVRHAGDLDPAWFAGCRVVGLTAGTSTLDATIDEVADVLRDLTPAKSSSGPRTSGEWCRHFLRNAAGRKPIPWATVSSLGDDARRAIARSVAVFQRGESGEGTHLLHCAERHANDVDDPNYLSAMRMFVREEQQHAAWLGHFLDDAGLPRITGAWSDGVFRWLRHRAGLELTITVLVTAEILANVYYAALRDATDCPALRELCGQVLRDEVAHVRFQCERIAILQRRNSGPVRRWKRFLHACLYAGAAAVLWTGHRRVFRAAGMGVRSYVRRAWGEFRRAGRIDSHVPLR